VSTSTAIYQYDIAKWTWKERGREGQETKAPSPFLKHLSMPCPTLQEICKEKIPLCRVPRCPVNAAALSPKKKKLKP